ncbi:MAG: hypothetical protein N2Z76_05540 [Treponemataceae bacterium]|nr:hypothetical protein [Treponemataceae bacterium]
MILTILAFILPFFLIFFVDVEIYLVTCAYLYSVLVSYKATRKEWNLIDILLLGIYLFLFFLNSVFKISNFIPYTGAVIYFSLSIVFLIASKGVPIISTKTRKRDPDLLFQQKVTYLFLVFLNVLAFILTFVLFPSIYYIIVPLCISIGSIPFVIFLLPKCIDFFLGVRARFFLSEEQSIKIKEIFENLWGFMWISDNLYGKEVWNQKEREMFFNIIEKGYFSIYQKSKDLSCKNYNDFIKKIKEEYFEYAHASTTFVVYDSNIKSPVGCIRMVIKRKPFKEKLPMEKYIPVSLSRLTSATLCVAEVGRFVILSQGVQKAKVLEILMNLVIVKAILSKVRILLTDAVEENILLYEKMGMIRIKGPFYDEEFHQNTWLMGVDVAAILSSEEKSVWSNSKYNPRAGKYIKKYLNYIKKQNEKLKKENKSYLTLDASIESLVEYIS